MLRKNNRLDGITLCAAILLGAMWGSPAAMAEQSKTVTTISTHIYIDEVSDPVISTRVEVDTSRCPEPVDDTPSSYGSDGGEGGCGGCGGHGSGHGGDCSGPI